MEPLPTSYFVGAFGVTAVLCLALPVAVIVAVRRTELRARAVLVGMLTFAVSQLFTRIPAVALLQSMLADWIAASATHQWIWLVALCFSAGLFEETARALGFRFLLGSLPDRPATPVAAGLGHGGLEAFVLVGVGSAVTAGTFLWLQRLESLPFPPEAAEAVVAQRDAMAAMGGLGPLAALYERTMSIALHVALSVLVFHAVRARRWWLVVLAILLHGVANLGTLAVADWVGPGLRGVWLSELTLTLLVAATVVLVWRIVRGTFDR